MQDDVNFLNHCINILNDESNSEELLRETYKKLIIFTPSNMPQIDADIIWDRAWNSCPPNVVDRPPASEIRKCGILFCKMLLQKIPFYD